MIKQNTYIELCGVNGIEWWEVNDRQGANILKVLKEAQIRFKKGVKAAGATFDPKSQESEPGELEVTRLHSDSQDCV